MAEQHAGHQQPYDPLWNKGGKTGGGHRWARLAVGLSLAAHAGLIYYLYETKIAAHYKQYSDDAITAKLLTLPRAPPPEPPKPPKPVQQEPPSRPRPIDQHFSRPSTLTDAPIPLTFAPPEPPEPPPPLADPLPPQPRLIANPKWSSRPSPDDMARYYPERAQRLGKAGSVSLQCQVTAKGALLACSVLSEDPVEFGFGEAALKLSRLFRLKPKIEDGEAVEGALVKIPIAFRIAN